MDEQERREFEHDAADLGIPLMLDRMGLDGLGNEVVLLYKRIIELKDEVGDEWARAELAIARIAEMEARLEQALDDHSDPLVDWLRGCLKYERELKEQAEAERDALRDRRCAGCAHWDNIFCDNPESLAAGKLSPPDIEFCCNCWLDATPPEVTP